jgi:hypothetical protein
MRKFTIFLFSIFCLLSKAQTLTNGQVYNYDIGDVFQIEHSVYYPNWCTYTLPSIWTDSVISKSYSFTGDTVTYVLHRDAYTPQLCAPPCTPTWNSAFYTVSYDTSSTAFHYPYPFSSPTSDTLINDSAYCNKLTWFEYGENDTASTSETVITTSWLVSGCGGPYYDVRDDTGPTCFYHKLFYFRKGGTTCGTYYYHAPNPVTVPEYSHTRLLLFPNPADSKLNVTGCGDNSSYIISDNSGRKIVEGLINEESVDISKLAKGSYFITFLNDNKEKITKSFIKN